MRKIFILTILLLSNSVMSFDHSHKLFDNILKESVIYDDKQSWFNYKDLDTKKLNIYLKSLSKVSKKEFNSFTKDQQLAFLINAYNAFTIKLIKKNYPLKTIKSIGSIFKSAWKIRFINFLGDKVHLDNIEHDMIRKNFNEPRIHFAVNCASIGCPSLLNRVFIADRLEIQLSKVEKDFLTDFKKNRVDHKNNKIYLSKIFKWYGKDFTKNYGTLNNYIIKFFKKTEGKKNIKLDKLQKYSIEWTYYNWDLNEKKSKSK